MDNPERKIHELERELRVHRERLKFLESEIKKKDELINAYWARI